MIQHKKPTQAAKKQILASCGNQCAFSGCDHTIIDRVGKKASVRTIAHIKARREGGPRFDSSQTEEENRSAINLVALCDTHHNIVDEREDIYTLEKMITMKTEHEEKVENSADRSWIRFPNFQIRLENLNSVQINYWIDRSGRLQVYTDRKLQVARTVFDIYQDINKLCQLYEMAENNPEVPCKSLIQSNTKLNKNNANLENDTPWTPIAQILCQMAEVPEITFGELLSYIVQGGDATNLFIQRAKVLQEKIKKTKT